jgi:AraC-like DNA-binding protein
MKASMDHEVNTTSWIALLEQRDRLVAKLRHDVPDGWPRLVATFLRDVQPFSESLPHGVVLLLLTDVARELDRVAGQPAVGHRPSLLVSLDPVRAGSLSSNALCDHFDAAVCAWCTRLAPGSLLPEVQAHRLAEYIDQHFAEPITLATLGAVSGWCTRELSRAFRSSMRVSIRQYLQATRIDQAAARLRQGDKVESVVAAVGWRGRKNFFRHFKARFGTTPAQYREGWTALSAASETTSRMFANRTGPAASDRHRSRPPAPRAPRSPQFQNAASSNCGTV